MGEEQEREEEEDEEGFTSTHPEEVDSVSPSPVTLVSQSLLTVMSSVFANVTIKINLHKSLPLYLIFKHPCRQLSLRHFNLCVFVIKRHFGGQNFERIYNVMHDCATCLASMFYDLMELLLGSSHIMELLLGSMSHNGAVARQQVTQWSCQQQLNVK